MSSRTAQRYAKERALPVHKDGETLQAPVWAYVEDLEAWQATRIRPARGAVVTATRWLRDGSVAALTGVGILLALALSRPADQPEHGWVAFTSVRNGTFDISRVRDDGSELRNLTDRAGRDVHPSISPDGRLIAFSSNVNGLADLWIMSADGGDLRPLRIAQNGSRCMLAGVSWSPDGRWIAFSNRIDDVWRVFRIRPNGEDLEEMTDGVQDATAPWYDIDGLTLYATIGTPFDGRSRQVKAIASRTGRPHVLSLITDTYRASQIWIEGFPRVIFERRHAQGIFQVLFQETDGTSTEWANPLGDYAGYPIGPRGPGANSLNREFIVSKTHGMGTNLYRVSTDGRYLRLTALGGDHASWWAPVHPIPLAAAAAIVPAPLPLPPDPHCVHPPEGDTVFRTDRYRGFVVAERPGAEPHVHVTTEFRHSVDPESAGQARIRLSDLAATDVLNFTEADLREIVQIVRVRRAELLDAWHAGLEKNSE